MPKCQEGALSVDPASETDKDRGGGPTIVSKVILGSGAGGIMFWGGDLGFVGGDIQEAGGSARGLPQTCDGQKSNRQRGRTWRSVAAMKVLKEAGIQTLEAYI